MCLINQVGIRVLLNTFDIYQNETKVENNMVKFAASVILTLYGYSPDNIDFILYAFSFFLITLVLNLILISTLFQLQIPWINCNTCIIKRTHIDE